MPLTYVIAQICCFTLVMMLQHWILNYIIPYYMKLNQVTRNQLPRWYTENWKIPVQTPLGTWQGCGTQPYHKAPGDLRISNQELKDTDWHWVSEAAPLTVAQNITSFFFAKPPLKSANYPRPFYRQFPPIYWYCVYPPKNQVFKWTLIILRFFIFNPISCLLKVTKFLVKISLFKLTEKHFCF